MKKLNARQLVPYKQKRLRFGKYLDITTGHVTRADMGKLERDDCPLVAYPYNEGCWVHIADDVTRNDLERLGFSEGFCGVFVMVRAASCQFIKLDCDGWQYAGLKHYDW